MIEQQSRKKREVKNVRAFIDSSPTTPFFFRPRLLATRSFSSISTIGKAITRYVGHKSNCQSVSPSLSHVEEASSFWGSSFILQQMIHDGLAFYLESTSFRGNKFTFADNAHITYTFNYIYVQSAAKCNFNRECFHKFEVMLGKARV